MDYQLSRVVALLMIIISFKCQAIRVGPCPTNKIAPYSRPEGKTLGFLFGLRPTGTVNNDPTPNCGSVSNPDDNPSLVTIDSDTNQGVDYDPVNSEEDTVDDNQSNVKPPPVQRPTNFGNFGNIGNIGNFGNFQNWWPGIVTPDNWPSRPPRPVPPHRPQRPQNNNNWFWSWFGSQNGQNRPPKPAYDEVTKPVYEYIEDDYQSTTWKPGLLVGGPNSDIIGVTQDISNWSTVPTPRPTRPFIPGQRAQGNRNNRRDQTILGSFIDLLFRK